MDLNQLPRDTFDIPSTFDIKIVCRKKANCRAFLVRKYGEERANGILRNPDPMVLTNVTRYVVIVLILHS